MEHKKETGYMKMLGCTMVMLEHKKGTEYYMKMLDYKMVILNYMKGTEYYKMVMLEYKKETWYM